MKGSFFILIVLCTVLGSLSSCVEIAREDFGQGKSQQQLFEEAKDMQGFFGLKLGDSKKDVESYLHNNVRKYDHLRNEYYRDEYKVGRDMLFDSWLKLGEPEGETDLLKTYSVKFIASDDIYYRIKLFFLKINYSASNLMTKVPLHLFLRKNTEREKDGMLQIGLRYLVKYRKSQLKAILHGKMKRLSLSTMIYLSITIRKINIPQ